MTLCFWTGLHVAFNLDKKKIICSKSHISTAHSISLLENVCCFAEEVYLLLLFVWAHPALDDYQQRLDHAQHQRVGWLLIQEHLHQIQHLEQHQNSLVSPEISRKSLWVNTLSKPAAAAATTEQGCRPTEVGSHRIRIVGLKQMFPLKQVEEALCQIDGCSHGTYQMSASIDSRHLFNG